jgi:hypothetical protein
MLKEHMKFGLIVFFLAFTLADIGVPGFCRTDDHAAGTFGSADFTTAAFRCLWQFTAG